MESNMNKRTKYLAVSVAIFSGLLVLGWTTHGTGVVQDDPERNIVIPDELTSTLQVRAAYDGERIWFRYRWPTERPSIFNDVLVYQDGEWIRRGGGSVGPNPDYLTEDRVSMMIDDGSVPLFSRYGGYITIGDGLSSFTGSPDTGEERTKYVPSSRTDPNNFDSIRPESELETLRAAGQFIDLWQWRSSRSNPIGLADDGFVAEERSGDAGTGPYTTNFDRETGQPRYMFNPEVAGSPALSLDAVIAGDVGFNDVYYLSAETAVAFDPSLDWQNGDTIPRRYLRPTDGSRGDVTQPAAARWRNGFWDVTLVRDMDTGNPDDDKIFRDGGNYDLAFAVFRNASTMRWHYVTLPVSLGLEQPAQLVAERIEPGTEPDWSQPWTEITTFYPGQVTWGRLTDAQQHPGADRIAARVPVAARHSEEQLAIYGVQMEFAEEIRAQWIWTLIVSLGLIVGLGINVNLLMRRREEEL
jgi:ethylbenzene dehydrogenase